METLGTETSGGAEVSTTQIELPGGASTITITLTITIAPVDSPVPDPGPDPDPTPTPDPGSGGVPSDYDGDGQIDTLRWDFGDGTWQELWDVDGDLDADILVVDTNGDAAADFAITDNGDGTYTVYVDSDGDGQWDDEGQTFTRVELDEALPGVTTLLDTRLA